MLRKKGKKAVTTEEKSRPQRTTRPNLRTARAFAFDDDAPPEEEAAAPPDDRKTKPKKEAAVVRSRRQFEKIIHFYSDQ